jgi:hypothetical protein
MFRHPQNPNFLSDTFLGDDEDFEMASDYAECSATEEAWNSELRASPCVKLKGVAFLGTISGSVVE